MMLDERLDQAEPTAVPEVDFDATGVMPPIPPADDEAQAEGTDPELDQAAADALHTLTPLQADPNDPDDDGIFAAEFDAMFKARYVAALVSSGPSLAMEERILANLRAAQDIREEALAAGAVPPEGDVLTDAAIARATGQVPIRQRAMATAAPMQAAAHFEVIPGGVSEATSTSQLDGAARASGARSNDFFRRLASIVGPEHRTLRIAAAALAALLVIGVARGVTHVVKGGASNAAAPEAPAAMMLSEESDATVGAYEDEAEIDYAAAESKEWQAVVCPNIVLSTGEQLEVVFGENGPQEVEPTNVGEFVENAKATGPDGTLDCEVFHIIAQSEGDGALYAVTYADDGAFYLARAK